MIAFIIKAISKRGHQSEYKRSITKRRMTYLVGGATQQYLAEEGSSLTTGRLLIEHSSLDHLLVHVQLVSEEFSSFDWWAQQTFARD